MADIFSSSVMASESVRSSWRDLDWVMIAVVLIISVWGCLAIHSATLPREEATVARAAIAGEEIVIEQQHTISEPKSVPLTDTVKQAMWIVLGVLVMFALAMINYQWLVHFQFGLYALNLAFLLLLLLLPASLVPVINGAKSWIRLGPLALQPAEFCKFAVIVSLAAFLARRQERIRELPVFGWSLLYLSPALVLILKQPDLGTTLAVLAIWFGMMYFGGARLLHLAGVACLGVLLLGVAWQTGVLKPHQKDRLAVFLERDSAALAKREGYQIKQSEIAIGSGQLTGQGYGKGRQNRSRYVPENKTDFIFTVVAEEQGFIGAVGLLLLYLILLFRTAATAASTDNYFGVLIAGGFTVLLAFHTIQNIGMTMRVLPITGVPLPFFSYGGSAYLAFSMCVGLVQSVVVRAKRRGF